MWLSNYVRKALADLGAAIAALGQRIGNPGTGKTLASRIDDLDTKLGDPGEGKTIASLLEEILDELRGGS